MKLKKPLKKFTWKDWSLTLLLTIGVFFLFLLYNNGDFIFKAEESLLSKINTVKEKLIPIKYKAPNNFVFINVSKDLELVTDETGGDNVITNRGKLTSFFKLLAEKDEYQYLLCDIIFDLPSDHDSALLYEIKKLKRALFPMHLNDTGIAPSIFPLHSAIADYNTNTNKFSKFKLMYRDGIKTIPVVLHEQLQNVRYSTWLGNPSCNNKFCLQSISPRYYIRPDQLIASRDYPYFNLGELLILSGDPSFYDKFLKNKFIVIGNFDTDTHITPAGKMPGVLILINTYLSLLNGRQVPGFWWFLTIFAMLFLINIFILFRETKEEITKKKEKWWTVLIKYVFVELFSEVSVCLIIAMISEFVFHIRAQTLVIFLYIASLNFILKYFRHEKAH